MTDSSDLRNYVEELTLVLEQIGLPRTSARILAWLLVCEPAEQTMNDLMDALQLSKSSVSAATQSLIQYKLIDRISLPGQRRDYYRVQEGVWNKVMQVQIEETRRLRAIAEKGLRLTGRIGGTPSNRLQEMSDYTRFLEQEMPAMLERWMALRAAAGHEPSS